MTHRARSSCKRLPGLALLLFALCVVPSALGRDINVVRVDSDTGRLELGDKLQFLPETDTPLTLDDILSLGDVRWQPAPNASAHVGVRPAPVWFRLEIRTGSLASTQTWLLDSGVATPAVFEMYLVQDGNVVASHRAAKSAAEDIHTLGLLSHALAVELQPDSRYQVYARVDTPRRTELPLAISRPLEFFPSLIADFQRSAMTYGALLAILAFCLAILVAGREVTHLYYLGMVACFALYLASLDGYGLRYLWFWWPGLQQVAADAFLVMAIMASLLFVRQFLAVGQRWPRLDRVMAWFLLPLLFQLLLLPVLPAGALLISIYVFVLATYLLIMAACVLAFIARQPLAIYALVSWLPLLVLTVVVIYRQANLLPVTSPGMLSVIRISILAMLFIQALGIGQRMRLQRVRQELLIVENAAKTEMIERVAHQVRTPLNTIIGNSVLLRKYLGERDAAQHNETIHSAAKSLLSEMETVLNTTRRDSGEVEVVERPFDLPQLLGEVAAIVEAQFGYRNLSFKLDIDVKTPARVSGDRGQLRQVLLYLLSYQSKIASDGIVCLNVAPDPRRRGFLCFNLSDNQGEASAERPGLLRSLIGRALPFRRTGLAGDGGLEACRQLVGLMGGDLQLPNSGAGNNRCGFSLPLPAREPVEAEPEPQLPITRAPDRYRILVAEDNPPNRMLIKAFLDQLGHPSIIVKNGEQAVEHFRKHADEIDVILMDCEMPVMDGYTATREIRWLENQRGLSRIPILAVTAHAYPDHRRQCLEAGMDEELHKPVDLKQLSRVIAKYGKARVGETRASA